MLRPGGGRGKDVLQPGRVQRGEGAEVFLRLRILVGESAIIDLQMDEFWQQGGAVGSHGLAHEGRDGGTHAVPPRGLEAPTRLVHAE